MIFCFFIALVSTVQGVQLCLVRKWLVNHLNVYGSQVPNSCEILELHLNLELRLKSGMTGFWE